MHPRARTLSVFLFYVAAAVLLTWPLAAHLGTAIPTAGVWSVGDPGIFVWIFDWCAKIITHALPVPPGQMLFYPQGIAPLAGYDGPLMLLVGVPLTLLTGNALLAYDLFILLAISGSAFAAYLLGLRLLRSVPAAAFVGFLFGLSPYVLIRAAQHPNLLMVGTLPLLVLAALNCSDKPTRPSAYAWLALAAAANAASSWYYAIAGLLFAGLVVAFHHAEWRKHLVQLLAGGLLVVAATAVVALPMFFSTQGERKPASAEFTARMGAQPVDFVLPSGLTNVFGSLRKYLHDDPPPIDDLPVPNAFERSTYFGLPLLAMVLYFALRRREARVPLPWLWLTGFCVFTVLALGSELSIFGHQLPLPFAALRHLFPFSLARVPNRFFVAALLCAAIMAGDVVARLIEKKFFASTKGKALAIITVALLLAERIIFPYPLSTPEVSAFYTERAADTDTYAIADLPNPYPQFPEYDLFQITHGKPITGGDYFYPAFTADTYAFMRENPLLRISLCDHRLDDGRPLDLEQDVWPSFRNQNVRYVVLHNLVFRNEPSCGGVLTRIREVLKDEKPVFTDGELTVYRVP